MENYQTWDATMPTRLVDLSLNIRQNGLFVEEVHFKYNRKQVLTMVGGQTDCMSLSNAYYQAIEEQTIDVRKKVIESLIKTVDCPFEMHIPVDENGKFDEERIHIRFKVDVIKEDRDVAAIFREPFRVLLPFADFVTEINIRGHRHRMSVVEASLILGIQDILDVIHNPFVGEKVKNQWATFAHFAYMEAKKVYKCNVVIPCFEGELEWSISRRMTLQFVEFCEPRV